MTLETATEPPPMTFKSRLKVFFGSWATRSLMIGALATGLDLMVGLTLLSVLTRMHVEDPSPTRLADMTGFTVGATFTFFANRRFAFHAEQAPLVGPLVRFVLATFVLSMAHSTVVVFLRDRAGVSLVPGHFWSIPYVPAKLMADLAVSSVGQLLVLRYIVFPKKK